MMRIVKNLVLRSPLTNTFYFVKKAKLLDGCLLEVVGEKIDVTKHVESFIREALDVVSRPDYPDGRMFVVELQDDYGGDGSFVVCVVVEDGALLKERWVFRTLSEAREYIRAEKEKAGEEKI